MAQNREHSAAYLAEQYEAMRWLRSWGLTPEQIAGATWGMVDETIRSVAITEPARFYRYDRKKGAIEWEEYGHKEWVSVKGESVEHFFLKSQIFCGWMFTRERPKSWRKEKSADSRFPVSEVEKIVAGVEERPKNLLTNLEQFATIEIAEVNIRNSAKDKELVKSDKT